MEFIGVMAFILAISNMGSSDKVKKLKMEVKKVKNSIKGEKKMSEMLKELEGKTCMLTVCGSLTGTINCEVITVDDEWMKISQIVKKGQNKIRLIKIENINEVSII